MFIIFFSIFIFVLTVFENIFVALIILVLSLGAYFVYLKTPGLNRLRKITPGSYVLIILAFILSLSSVLFYNYSYSQKTNSFSTSTGLISQNMTGPNGTYFVGTGNIKDIYSYQRFVFQDNNNRQYLLNSQKEYQIGDQIWINGYVNPAYTGSKNIFKFKNQIIPRGHKSDVEDPGVFSLSGFFAYEFDYPKRLMMKGFYGTIYEQNSVIATDPGVIFSEDYKTRGQGGKNLAFLQSIRKKLQQNIIETYGKNPQAGLILGMLVGDKSQIPKTEYQGFISSGLVHIIAVSGGNIIMIVIFLGAVLFFLPFYARNAVILATIILYAMICGMDSSVFRATIMGGLGMLALFRGREINIRRAMSVAFVVMLFVNPYFLVYDVGFLLSFSAIIGIVYFGKAIEPTPGSKKDPGVKKLFQKFSKEYITPTVGATLGVLPVMLFFMGQTNLTGILANFLVVPIVAFVMIYGFVSTMIYQILPRDFFLWPEKIMVSYIYKVSDLANQFGLFLSTDGYWVKYAFLILFLIWFVYRRIRD